MSESQEVRTELAVEDTQEQRQRTWVKVVLGANLPPRKLINRPGTGPRSVVGEGRSDSQAASERYRAEYEPMRDKLQTSLGRTHRVQLDGDVRDAESYAFQAASEIESAAAEKNWVAAVARLGPFETALSNLDAAYEKATVAVDEKIGRSIGKLEDKGNQVNAKAMESVEGVAISSADDARYRLIQARAIAKHEPPGVERLVALAEVLDAVKATSANTDRELKIQGNQALVAGSTELRDRAAAAINRLPAGEQKTTLTASLADWDNRKQAADALRDVDKQQMEYTALDMAAAQLLDQALGAAGGTKAAADKQKAYKAALMKRYGIQIEVPSGKTNTHFDRVYEMFAQVPIQHSKTSSLETLKYAGKPNKGAYGGATIQIGDYGDATSNWNYKEPANGFNMTTLHELGHSVDDKYGIMKSHRGENGCGAWKEETLDSVGKAVAEDFKANAGKSTSLTPKDVLARVKAALTKGTVKVPKTGGGTKKTVPEYGDGDKPKSMADADWVLLQALLNDCVKIRTTGSPWRKNGGLAIGNRVYHESYPGQWVSYSQDARDGSEVRDYQWRAPGEWFAELYAYSWYKKEAPPGSIPRTVSKYMWKPPK